MNRSVLSSMVVLATLAFVTAAQGAPLDVPWANGDFELGGVGWTGASGNSYVDADGDGDNEAIIRACGDGSFQLARGATIGPVPATSDIAFDVEAGQVDFWDIRVILVDHDDPTPYLNNFGAAPNWLDDDVLAWFSWSDPLTGSVHLDPVEATGFNIEGWSTMTADEREAHLSGMSYITFVMYACVIEQAAIDDFRWIV